MIITFKCMDGQQANVVKSYITSVYEAPAYWIVSCMPNTFFYVTRGTADNILAEMKK